MNDTKRVLAWTALALLAAALPGDGWAKVAFTGYSAVNFIPYSDFQIKGPPALLNPANLANGAHILGSGFNIDAVGLFATTKIDEDTTFAADFTYRTIGNTVGQTRIQYAYLDTALPWNARLQAGRMILPFGYYNTHRFYPFQRIQLSAPLFQSNILGLPIADTGAMLMRDFDLGAVLAHASVYGVNGYGSTPGSTTSFRNASLPNANLSAANNLGSSNNNRDIAIGGQLALERPQHDAELGLSYYEGKWDRDDNNLLQMSNAHLHLAFFGSDLLAEVLHLDVEGDNGFMAAVGSPHWTTDGGFVEVAAPFGSLRGKPLTIYGRGENYWSQAKNGGGGKETIHGATGGFSLRQSDNVEWKLEYYYLDYTLPSTTTTSLELKGWRSQLGMVITF